MPTSKAFPQRYAPKKQLKCIEPSALNFYNEVSNWKTTEGEKMN